jgi:hypothetical protein
MVREYSVSHKCDHTRAKLETLCLCLPNSKEICIGCDFRNGEKACLFPDQLTSHLKFQFSSTVARCICHPSRGRS